MKKKKIICVTSIVALLILGIVFFNSKDIYICEHFDIGTVDKVIIYYPGDNVTIVEQDDMMPLVEMLISMKGKKAFRNNKDGYTCAMELYHENDEMNRIILTSEYFVIDDNYYKCDRDYCDDFRKVYEQLTE